MATVDAKELSEIARTAERLGFRVRTIEYGRVVLEPKRSDLFVTVTITGNWGTSGPWPIVSNHLSMMLRKLPLLGGDR